MDYKQAFLSQLENSYLGVQIQDAKDLFSQDSLSKQTLKKSGFINLLQMKSKYFGHIKNLLEKEKLNHSIYTKLYNFFSSYLNETGTPFFYDTPMHKNIYAKVYTNSKDTSLFYKTQNLYYVKSDTLYHDAEITSQDSKYTFIFDTSHFIPNADNAKNKAIFKFTIEENIRIYVLNDKESLKELPNVFKQNSSDLSDEFIKSLKDKKIQLQEEEIKKILSSFKDLESTLNGELIKSDNFQALNTLLPKYQNKVDLIYIDPPYNAPASEIIYKNNFKDSTWLAMMANRLDLAKGFLSERGILSCAIDENEQENLGLLLSDIFYEYEKTCVSVEHNPKGIQGDNFSYSNEFAYFLIPDDAEIQNEIIEMQYKELMKTGKESERYTAKNCFYPIYVKDSKIIGFGNVCKEDFHPQKKIINNKGILEIYPIDSNGNERKWRYSRESVENVKENLKVFFTKDSITIKLGKTEKSFKTMWYGAKYSATEYGSKILKDILPNNDFDYPKSIHTVKDSIYLASKEDSTILDFFGGSGTTAHAVLELNREGSNRKFVLVEMGEHFYNVIIPRIKKVAFSSEWKNGELKNAKQVNPISIAFRYYELESYEESLSNCEYVLDKDSIIDYRKSRKLIKGLKKGEAISLDMNGYREGFDILHTMANVLGLKIQRLFLDSKGIECAEFDNGDIVSSDSVDLCKYPKLTNLIWWER